jgi:hypothetical protein
MKLSNPIKSNDRRRQHRPLSGQILAEACIGLSLMVLLWILLSFSTYMANNRIRTAMAARDAVWLQANGETTGSIPKAFFFGSDVNLAAVVPGQQFTLQTPIPSPWSGSAWSNSVTFGMSAGNLSGTTKYPFVLLNTHVPFMPASLLDNFLSVNSGCAWPNDVGNTYNQLSDALGLSGIGIPSF